MYRKNKMEPTTIQHNESYVGETIEQKINRIVNNKEPIKDGAPLIYTDREEGVPAATDVRTDRWEIAVDAMDKVTKTHVAQREQRLGEKSYDTMTPEQQKAFNEKFPKNKFAGKIKDQSTDTTANQNKGDK